MTCVAINIHNFAVSRFFVRNRDECSLYVVYFLIPVENNDQNRTTRWGGIGFKQVEANCFELHRKVIKTWKRGDDSKEG